jgi:hypothetical protein
MKYTFMVHKIKIIIFTSLISLLAAFSVCAQDNNEYKKKEGKQRDRENQIPAKESTPIKNIERIVGTWEVSAVYNGNKDITNTDTVGSDQVFVLPEIVNISVIQEMNRSTAVCLP